MLLDQAATTREAVNMLQKYDMQSSAGKPYHFFISDTSGETVIVDWPDQTMNVLDHEAATNFQLSPGKTCGEGIGHSRFKKLKAGLEKSKKDSGMTPAQAMDLLEEVSIKWNGEWQTEWSVVYHLDDFCLDICNDMSYSKVHHFKD